MNEIEKLYENAGVKSIKQGYCDWDGYCPNPDISCGDDCSYWKYEDETKYPSFTAEKQLELIKLLLDKYCDIRIRKNLEGAYYIKSFNDISCFSEDFEETLASFTNTHWQDLTEEERKQIKDILK